MVFNSFCLLLVQISMTYLMLSKLCDFNAIRINLFAKHLKPAAKNWNQMGLKFTSLTVWVRYRFTVTMHLPVFFM